MFVPELPSCIGPTPINRRLVINRLLEGLDEQSQNVVLRRLLADHLREALRDDLRLVVGDGHVRLLQG